MIKQPRKADTLAEKAEKRSRKLLLGRKLISFTPQWLIGTSEAIALLIIFGVNVFLLLPFFALEHSADGFSAPLIPLLSQITTLLMSYSHGVRFWLLVFLLSFPLSIYFFIREISQRKLSAFIASLIVSLPVGLFLPLRIRLGLLAEDGGQVASLTLTVFVCLFLLRFLRGGSFKMALATSLGITLVALTSPLGFFILFCFAIALTFSEVLLAQGRLKLLRFMIVFILAAGFSAFWYNPGFVLLIVGSLQGQLIKETLVNLFPLSFFLAPVLGVFGFLLFENQPRLQSLFLAVFLSLSFGLLSLGTGLELSTPSRFLPAFGASLAFLAGVLLTKIFDYLQKSPHLEKFKFFNRFRKEASFLSLSLFILMMLIIINTQGKSFRKIEELEVLGASTVKRTGIWEIRKESKGFSHILGTSISLMTLAGTVYIGIKLKRENHHAASV